MDITKQITVIDKEKVKVGDKFDITDEFNNKIRFVVDEVFDDKVCFKFDTNKMEERFTLNIKKLAKYILEKVESSTSKFAIGQLYRVEDTYSCDKFDVLITTVSDSEITAMKLKSASVISINESDIDNRYKFTKIKTVIEDDMYGVEPDIRGLKTGKKDVDELIKDIFRTIYRSK